jgi:hypothetical protein
MSREKHVDHAFLTETMRLRNDAMQFIILVLPIVMTDTVVARHGRNSGQASYTFQPQHL